MNSVKKCWLVSSGQIYRQIIAYTAEEAKEKFRASVGQAAETVAEYR